ncbi:hypothetical protein O181_049253 [Austropuccinia psidii MF-1]|uniref:Uncharacterized protein n=1 Tax=Austropuccinia psidii MF-1 TaxID=1389203 RepID=A0A9Q3DX53_9BASI|nr:hypothetical protein [Austropuccinia psidii MF-1]
MKTTNRHMFRWKLDGLSRGSLDNVKINPNYDPEVASTIPIHLMETDKRRNFEFSEWAPEFGTSDNDTAEPKGIETPILGINSSELHNEFFRSVTQT